jgi:hypothetical protein
MLAERGERNVVVGEAASRLRRCLTCLVLRLRRGYISGYILLFHL